MRKKCVIGIVLAGLLVMSAFVSTVTADHEHEEHENENNTRNQEGTDSNDNGDQTMNQDCSQERPRDRGP
jgi:hypothetical protein